MIKKKRHENFPRKRNTTELTLYVKKVFITMAIVGLFVAVFLIVQTVIHVFFLVFAGMLLAVFFSGVSKFVARYTGIPRQLALTVVVIFFFGSLIGFGFLIGPDLSDQFAQMEARIPKAIDSIEEWMMQYEWTRGLMENIPSAEELIPSATGFLGEITGFFSSALGTLINIVIIFFIGIYFAINPRLYIDNAINVFPIHKRKRAHEVIKALARAMRWWLVGRFSSMLVIGILVGIGFWIIGVPLALTLAFITALLSFIPFIGPFLSFIPAMLVAIMEGPSMILYVSIVYLAVQTLESYIITPYIEHRAVSIPPALLITMQVLMGVLTGILGILLATPITVVIIVIIQMLYIEGMLNDTVRVLGDKTKGMVKTIGD